MHGGKELNVFTLQSKTWQSIALWIIIEAFIFKNVLIQSALEFGGRSTHHVCSSDRPHTLFVSILFVMCIITNLCCFPKGYSEENVGNLSQTIFAINGRDSFLSACFFPTPSLKPFFGQCIFLCFLSLTDCLEIWTDAA